MAQKGYKGNSGKNLWVNQHYAKGVEYSNDTHREGLLKAIVNWDINQSGVSLRPRTPFFSSLFSIDNNSPIALNDSTFMFKPVQSENKEFMIEFNGEKRQVESKRLWNGLGPNAKSDSGVYPLDGDTIQQGDTKYRLLGIDAPEKYNEDGSENQNAINAKEALKSLLYDYPQSIQINVVYDKYAQGSVDVYGRELVWLMVYDSNTASTYCLNIEMLKQGHARIFGEYDLVDQYDSGTGAYPTETVVNIPCYEQYTASELYDARYVAVYDSLGLWGVETEGPVPYSTGDRTITISNKSIGIYSKYKNAELQAYQETAESLKLPVFDFINESHRINYSKVYKDLELDTSDSFDIQINHIITENEKNEFTRFSRYSPVDKIPFTDTFVFIGTIRYLEEEVYSGLISLRYNVPLKGNIPLFENWYFEVETYKNNVFKISWVNQEFYSPNLLDTNPITLQSFYGDDANDNGYSSATLITVIIKNVKGEIVETVEKGQTYTVEPIVALPKFTPDHTNGFDGYGIKWSVWNGSDYTFLDEHQANGSNGWRIAWDANGVELYDYEEMDKGIQLEHLPNNYYIANAYRLASQTYTLDVDELPFEWDPNQIQVQCEIAKVKLRDDATTYLYEDVEGDFIYIGTHSIIEPTLAISSLAEATNYQYEDNEELRTNYQHRQDLLSCTKLVHFDTRLLLYGSKKADNTIYVSDTSGNIKYFPYKNSLNRFQEKVLLVHPYQNMLVVFTVNNIYVVHIGLNENNEEILLTKLIMSNMTIKEEYINTVQNIGKDIVFLSNSDELKLLRPNPYIESEGDLLVGTLSQNINGLLSNSNQFITNRFQHYKRTVDIFNPDWKPTIETKVHIYNNEVHLYNSVSLPDDDDPYMYILVYNIMNRRWRIHDTCAMSFPYDIKVFDANEGPYVLCRNSININGGTTLMVFESLNLWKFDDGYGKLHDSKPIKLVDGSFVFNSALTTDTESEIEKVKMPLIAQIHPGYLDITPHLMKRFMQLKFVITNIDAVTIPVTLEFAIDGKIRQTANKVRMTQITDINNPDYGLLQTDYYFEPFDVEANESIDNLNISFQEWQLGVSKFGPGNKLEVKMGISGRGKIPSLELGFKVTGFFELFNYTIVYKEQSGR